MGRKTIEKEITEILKPFVSQPNNEVIRRNMAVVLRRYLGGLLSYQVICEGEGEI